MPSHESKEARRQAKDHRRAVRELTDKEGQRWSYFVMYIVFECVSIVMSSIAAAQWSSRAFINVIPPVLGIIGAFQVLDGSRNALKVKLFSMCLLAGIVSGVVSMALLIWWTLPYFFAKKGDAISEKDPLGIVREFSGAYILILMAVSALGIILRFLVRTSASEVRENAALQDSLSALSASERSAMELAQVASPVGAIPPSSGPYQTPLSWGQFNQMGVPPPQQVWQGAPPLQQSWQGQAIQPGAPLHFQPQAPQYRQQWQAYT